MAPFHPKRPESASWAFRRWRPQRWMRLHVVRGKFLTPGGGGGGGAAAAGGGVAACEAMDEEVWKKLPYDILWHIMLRLPPVMHLQLRLVSRSWRQMLTSADFKRAVTARARERDEQPRESDEQQCVSACVLHQNKTSRRDKTMDVLEINISLFVPRSFWRVKQSYSVLAADKGLVCISNTDNFIRKYDISNKYCVLNPLTRTCIVLPKLPFPGNVSMQLTTSTLTVYNEVRAGCNVATYDLTMGGRGEWHVRFFPCMPDVCYGGTYIYLSYRPVKVDVVVPGTTTLMLDTPSVMLLGLDPELYRVVQHGRITMVEHRRTLFLIASIEGIKACTHSPVHCFATGCPLWDYARGEFCTRASDVMCGVWRLARNMMEWEGVAKLDWAELEVITGHPRFETDVRAACVVGDMLFCDLIIEDMSVEVDMNLEICSLIMGLNLDTAQWERVDRDYFGGMPYARNQMPWQNMPVPASLKPMELRPDLYL